MDTLFSNAPAGADNRIAPGNNTVPFPEISAPLIFVGAVTCCDASYLAVHCRGWSYDITGSFTAAGIFMEGAFECI